MAAFAICLFLPTANEAKDNDQWWRMVIGMPILIATVQCLCLLLYYRHDTPKASLLRGEESEARFAL